MVDIQPSQPVSDGGLPPLPSSAAVPPGTGVVAAVDALMSQVSALPPAELKLFGSRFDEMRRLAAASQIVRLALHGLSYGSTSPVAEFLQGIITGQSPDPNRLPTATPIVSILKHAKDTLGTVLRVHADSEVEAAALPNPTWVRAALEKLAQQYQRMRDALCGRAFEFLQERGVFEEGEILLLEMTVNRAIDEGVPFFRYEDEIAQLAELLEPRHSHYPLRSVLVRGACETLLVLPRGVQRRVSESDFSTHWQRSMALSMEADAGVLSKLVQLRLWHSAPLTATDLRLLAQLAEDRFSLGGGSTATQGFHCRTAALERGPVIQTSALGTLSPLGSVDTVPDIVRAFREAGIRGCEITFHRIGTGDRADAKVAFADVAVPPLSLRAPKATLGPRFAERLGSPLPFTLDELQAVLKIARKAAEPAPPSPRPAVLPSDTFESQAEMRARLSLTPGLVRKLPPTELAFVLAEAGRTLPFHERIIALLVRSGFSLTAQSVDGNVARLDVRLGYDRGLLPSSADSPASLDLASNPVLTPATLERLIDLTRPEASRRFGQSLGAPRTKADPLTNFKLAVDLTLLSRLSPADEQQLAVTAGQSLPIELGIAAIFRQAGFREAVAQLHTDSSAHGLQLAYRYFDLPSIR